MIKIDKVKVLNVDAAIRGMRNPMNSWDKSDTEELLSHNMYIVGSNDRILMKNLAKAGPDHRKYIRMMIVSMDILAPLYWWKEFDTYKVGTVSNSCSTMYTIHKKAFERKDFSIEHIHNFDEHPWMVCMDNILSSLNAARERYLETKDKKYWWQIIQLLPSSYNQLRTITLNYEVLRNMYHSRRCHKLDEWVNFCEWIETLPYSELITDKENEFWEELSPNETT